MPVSFLGNLKKQFRKHNFVFGYKRWDVFCRSTWSLPPILFLIYRVVLAGWTTVGLALSGSIFFKDEYPVALYLTYWSMTALCGHLCLAAVNALIMAPWNDVFSLPGPLILDMNREDPLDEFDSNRRPADTTAELISRNTRTGNSRNNNHVRDLQEGQTVICNSVENTDNDDQCESDSLSGNNSKKGGEDVSKRRGTDPLSSLFLPIRLSIQLDWLLFAVACPYGVTVTLIYFTAMYPTVAREKNLTMPELDNFHVHGFNSIVITMEYVLAAYPVRLMHIIYPLMFGVTYLLVTVFYWLSDRQNHILYRGIVDWNHPARTMGYIGILAVFFIPLVHLLLFGLYRLRLFLCYKCLKYCHCKCCRGDKQNRIEPSMA